MYTTQTLPGKEWVERAKSQNSIEIESGARRATKEALIEERISIFDNEDNSKELKT